MNPVLGIIVALLGWLLAALVAIGTLGTALGVTPGPFAAAVQGSAPRLIVLGILLGTVLLVLDRELGTTMLPGGILLAGAFAWTLQLLPIAAVEGTATKDGFRIFSTNLLLTNDDVEHIATDVLSTDPDVLVTLEIEAETRDALARRLTTYRLVSVGDGERGRWAGIWVHERLDANVVSEKRLPVGDEILPGIEYRVQDSHGGGHRDVHVVGVHLHSPASDDGNAKWRTELADLNRYAEEHGDRLVLAGDFNAGSAHPGFAALLTHLRDAGRTPWGTGTPTWPVLGRGHGVYRAMPPTLDIDHVLTGKHLSARGHRAVRVHGSDHKGVVAEIVFRQAPHDPESR